MRIWIFIVVVAISLSAHAQTIHDPFVGGIEFGIGYGTVIDFNRDNNNISSTYLLERLLWLPFQIGFVSAKYFNPNQYLEIGVVYARKASSFVEQHYNADGSHEIALPTLTLHCIDIPLKYYSYVGKIMKQQMFAFGGLIPSWLVNTEYTSHIPEECFRNFYISVCGGLCFDKKKSRMKLHAGLAVTSIVNSSYREIPEIDRDYGGRIYPFELLFCYARMFR